MDSGTTLINRWRSLKKKKRGRFLNQTNFFKRSKLQLERVGTLQNSRPPPIHFPTPKELLAGIAQKTLL
jgi:hypothetical protein